MIQMLFRVQEKICWNRSLFGYYLCNAGAKSVENRLFSLCMKKRLPKVFYAFGSRMLQYENMWFVREILCDSSTAANQVNKKWAGTFCTRIFTGIIRKLLNISRLPREVPSVLDLLLQASSLQQMNNLRFWNSEHVFHPFRSSGSYQHSNFYVSW